PQTTKPLGRQNRWNRLAALHFVRAQIRCARRDHARRSIRQRHGQPKLPPEAPEAMSLNRPAEQRMSHFDDLHRAGENPAEMMQYVPFSGYLWDAAWCFFAEGDAAVEEWVGKKAIAVLEGKAGLVAAAIRRKATNLGLPAKDRKGADTCAAYLKSKSRYLDYPTALANGFPIATGVIEG